MRGRYYIFTVFIQISDVSLKVKSVCCVICQYTDPLPKEFRLFIEVVAIMMMEAALKTVPDCN